MQHSERIVTYVFLRRDTSEFLLMYKKQANIILFHALPELETALKVFFKCRKSDIVDLISNHPAICTFLKSQQRK